MKISVLRTFVIFTFTLASAFAAIAQDAPLKVTHVPAAGYTSEARANMVEGWIKLRITFLDTGAIGDIYYVNESDAEKSLTRNGLLKSAYEAAKKIKFTPATKDGKPATVTKVLQYDFWMGSRPGFQRGK